MVAGSKNKKTKAASCETLKELSLLGQKRTDLLLRQCDVYFLLVENKLLMFLVSFSTSNIRTSYSLNLIPKSAVY